MTKSLCKRRLLILLSVTLFTSACVHVPESLRVNEGTRLAIFENVKNDDASQQGELARWGGVIANVSNNSDNTMLEIVYFDLKSTTRPIAKDDTKGRFRVYYKGLLDPIIYKVGRSITAIGTISPSEKGKIGEHDYVYPVIKADHVHLWKEIKEVDVRISHQPMWYRPSLWYTRSPYYNYSRAYQPYGKSKAPVKVKK